MKTRVHVHMVFVAALLGFASVVRGETAYFLMGDPLRGPHYGNTPHQSYVVAVTDAAKIAEARAWLNGGPNPLYLIPQVQVALGADGINRNYSQPGQPPWDWHVVQLFGWTTYDPNGFYAAVVIPSQHSTPVFVPTLIAGFDFYPPRNTMSLVYYPLLMELKPEQAGNVLNVSTRGYVGTGERVLIAGFVVGSGAPRNVLVRGLGPSLAAFGVVEPLADPALAIYRGSELVASNDDWKSGNLWQSLPGEAGKVLPECAALAPLNDKESAVRLLLPPGSYSVIVRGGASGGIALAEVYDLDAMKSR